MTIVLTFTNLNMIQVAKVFTLELKLSLKVPIHSSWIRLPKEFSMGKNKDSINTHRPGLN